MGLSAEKVSSKTRGCRRDMSCNCESLTSSPAAVEAANLVWFDFINRDPAIEDARTKQPLLDRVYAGSTYD
jgi:hypothetical protein